MSVIIPVYNSARYLEQCLDSLINQTLQNIEIICVNDGSTDESLSILNRYKNQDNRIKVFNQDNKGQSAARNLGIKYSHGEYIGFLDSDDYADRTMFEKLYTAAKQNCSDVVMCSVHILNEKTGAITPNDPYFGLKIFEEQKDADVFFNGVFSYEQCRNFLFRICVVPWNKLIKTDFLKKNNIKFAEGLSFEDNIFSLELLLKAGRISLVNEPLPYYRFGSEYSLTYGTNDNSKLDLFEVFNKMEEVLKKNMVFDMFEAYFFNHKKNTLLYWYKKLNDPNVKDLYKKKLLKLYSGMII